MRPFYVLYAAALATAGAFADEPAVEQDFRKIAADGCKNRGDDIVVRGMVSRPLKTRWCSRISPAHVDGVGRAPRSRPIGGTTGRDWQEQRGKSLPTTSSASRQLYVVRVTLTCKGRATPVARNITYRTKDGAEESISY